jgi:hypothetical protein
MIGSVSRRQRHAASVALARPARHREFPSARASLSKRRNIVPGVAKPDSESTQTKRQADAAEGKVKADIE